MPIDTRDIRTLLSKFRLVHADHGIDLRAFADADVANSISPHALSVLREIRGIGTKPSIMLHGVMPRSGTVFAGNLIKLHPDVAAYPRDLWEIPFLASAGALLDFQSSVKSAYSGNEGKIGTNDLLAVFGAALVKYLREGIPDDKWILTKDPRVRFLNYFFAMFPDEALILLLRDGRDVVQSTVASWPHISFEDACREWNRSAELVWNFSQSAMQKSSRVLLVKFEDLVRTPITFVETVCALVGLDPARFPIDRLNSVPVQGSSDSADHGKVDRMPVAKTDNFQPIGRWRNWTSRQRLIFNRLAGETLARVGYADSAS